MLVAPCVFVHLVAIDSGWCPQRWLQPQSYSCRSPPNPSPDFSVHVCQDEPHSTRGATRRQLRPGCGNVAGRHAWRLPWVRVSLMLKCSPGFISCPVLRCLIGQTSGRCRFIRYWNSRSCTLCWQKILDRHLTNWSCQLIVLNQHVWTIMLSYCSCCP